MKNIGRYECMGVVLNNAVPRIIEDDTFQKVQKRIQANKLRPASAKGSVNFHLTGKLFCGKCGGNEEIAKPVVTKEHIKFFLRDIKNKVYNSEEQIDVIINTFVNAVYLYDDKMIITFNFRDGEELKKLELSDLEQFGFDDVSLTK